jgi:hypothetical protein
MMPADAFLPSRHGFAFANTFEIPSSPFGFGAPVAGSFGLCAGIAWAALDRYFAGRRVETAPEPPGPGVPLYAELLRRHANALGCASVAKLTRWQQLPDEGRPGAPGLRERSRAEWRRLRRRLDAGEPVLVVLILAAGPYANPTTNHMVLVYGYDVDRRAGRVALRVYDPNRPRNNGVRLVFRTRGRRLPLEARLAVDTRVRGFYAVAYDRPRPAPLAVCAVATAGGVTLPFAAESAPALAFGRDTLHLFGRDSAGRAVHAVRDPRGRWTGGRIVPRRSDGVEVASVPLPLGAAPWCLAVGRNGGLFELRKRSILGWKARPITPRKGAAALRVDARPATSRSESRPRPRFYAVAAGHLAAGRRTWRGWRLEWPGGPALTGTPAVVPGRRGAEHVFVRSAASELIHYRRARRGTWTIEHVTAALGRRDRFGIADDPVVLPGQGGLGVAARTASGDVLLFRWTSRRGWRCRNVSADLRSAGESVPAAEAGISATMDAGGTVHMAARCMNGGVLHFWSRDDGEAGVDEVVTTRAAIGDAFRVDGAPRIFAARGGWLHLVARRGGELLLFRWAPGADWTVESIAQLDPGERLGSGAEPSWLETPDCCHLAHAAAGSGVRYVRLGGVRRAGALVFAGRAVADVGAALAAVLALPVRGLLAVAEGVAGLGRKAEPGFSRTAGAAARGGTAVVDGMRRVGDAGARAMTTARVTAAGAVTSVGAAASGAISAAPAASANLTATTRSARAGAAPGAASETPAPAAIRPVVAAPFAATDATVAPTPVRAAKAHVAEVAPPVGERSITRQAAAKPQVRERTADVAAAKPQVRERTADVAAAKPQVRERTADVAAAKPQVRERTADVAAAKPQVRERSIAAEATPPHGLERRSERGEVTSPALTLTLTPEPAQRNATPDPGAPRLPAVAKAAPPSRRASEPDRQSPGAMPIIQRSAVIGSWTASPSQSNGGATKPLGSAAIARNSANAAAAAPAENGAAEGGTGTSPVDGGGRRKLNPALDGLPFIDDEDPLRPAPAPKPVVPPAERRKRDLEAMARIMSLAEEYSTKSGPSKGPGDA